MKSQILVIGAVTVLIVVVIFAAVYIGFSLSRSSGAGESGQEGTRSATAADTPESTTAPTPTPVQAEASPEASAAPSDTTAIPGYDTIRMKAGTLDQITRLYNPAENSCYFMVSIILPDGKELYRSNMIAPGETVTKIRLSSALEAGTYKEAALLYSCFSLGDLHPMNGATVKFTLEVS